MQNEQPVVMSDMEKVEALKGLVDFLSGRIEKFDHAKCESMDTFSLKENQEAREKFSTLVVPENYGIELAQKYDMTPNGKVGIDIDLLNQQNFEKLKWDEYVHQSQILIPILAYGILCGEYEYLRNKKIEPKEKFPNIKRVGLSMLAQDVDMVRANINPALDAILMRQDSAELQSVLKCFHSYANANTDFDGDFRLNRLETLEKWCENPEQNKAGIMQEKFHVINVLENDIGRPLFKLYRVIRYTFVKDNTWESYCSYSWQSPYNPERLFDIVSSVEKFGKNYVIAPAINLWVNKILSSIDSSIKYDENVLQAKKNAFNTKIQEVAALYDGLNLTPDLIKSLEKSTTAKRK